MAGRGNVPLAARFWNAQDDLLKALQVIGFIGWITFFAGIVSSQMTQILRLYEGYWNFPMSKYLRNIGENRHKKYLEKVKEAMQKETKHYNEIYLYYPFNGDQVMLPFWAIY